MERVIKHLAHLLRGKAFGTDQVRTTDISNKERIARKKLHRHRWCLCIRCQYRDALRRVAGSFKKSQPYLSQAQFIAIRDLVSRKLRCRSLSINDLGSRLCRKLDVPADKIGVRMSFDNVLDLLPICFG